MTKPLEVAYEKLQENNSSFRCSVLDKDPIPFKDFLGKANLPASDDINNGRNIDEMVGRLVILKDDMDDLDDKWRYAIRDLKRSLKRSLSPLWTVIIIRLSLPFEENFLYNKNFRAPASVVVARKQTSKDDPKALTQRSFWL